MTNIIASVLVSVVTNVTEVMPTKSIPAPCPEETRVEIVGGVVKGNFFGCLVDHTQEVPDPDAKTKTINTKCIEKTVLRFDWNGPREIVSERVLWESSQVLKLEWVAKP